MSVDQRRMALISAVNDPRVAHGVTCHHIGTNADNRNAPPRLEDGRPATVIQYLQEVWRRLRENLRLS